MSETGRSVIVVVDDDPDVRELYTVFLEPHFHALTAANGCEALEVLRTQRVDLAIIDVHMPVMNGAELIRAMRDDAKLKTMPVIVRSCADLGDAARVSGRGRNALRRLVRGAAPAGEHPAVPVTCHA